MPLTDEQLAESIVHDIIEQLRGRKGFDAWWNGIETPFQWDIIQCLQDRTQYWIKEARV